MSLVFWYFGIAFLLTGAIHYGDTAGPVISTEKLNPKRVARVCLIWPLPALLMAIGAVIVVVYWIWQWVFLIIGIDISKSKIVNSATSIFAKAKRVFSIHDKVET